MTFNADKIYIDTINVCCSGCCLKGSKQSKATDSDSLCCLANIKESVISASGGSRKLTGRQIDLTGANMVFSNCSLAKSKESVVSAPQNTARETLHSERKAKLTRSSSVNSKQLSAKRRVPDTSVTPKTSRKASLVNLQTESTAPTSNVDQLGSVRKASAFSTPTTALETSNSDLPEELDSPSPIFDKFGSVRNAPVVLTSSASNTARESSERQSRKTRASSNPAKSKVPEIFMPRFSRDTFYSKRQNEFIGQTPVIIKRSSIKGRVPVVKTARESSERRVESAPVVKTNPSISAPVSSTLRTAQESSSYSDNHVHLAANAVSSKSSSVGNFGSGIRVVKNDRVGRRASGINSFNQSAPKVSVAGRQVELEQSPTSFASTANSKNTDIYFLHKKDVTIVANVDGASVSTSLTLSIKTKNKDSQFGIKELWIDGKRIFIQDNVEEN